MWGAFALGTLGAYEVRQNPWLTVRSIALLMCALTLMIVAVRLVQEQLGLRFGLFLGWTICVPALFKIDFFSKTQR